MSETIKITPGVGLVIKYNGIFDFDKLYKGMHDWFMSYKYDFHEKENTKKSKDLGSFIEINWIAERNIDEYVKFLINVHIIIDNFNRVEKLDTGNMIIELSASLVLDYNNKWSIKPFHKFLFNIYNKYIIKEKINRYYIGKLYGEITDLQNTGKSILELYA